MPNHRPSVVPDGYHKVNPWVIPKGAAEFIEFLNYVFDGQEDDQARMDDRDGLIIHAEVRIGDSVILIFDSKDDWPPTPAFLQIYVENSQSVLERAKERGSEIITEITESWGGETLARLRDPWGNLWWVYERIREVDWAANATYAGEENQTFGEVDEPGYIYISLMDAMKTKSNG